MQDAGFRNPNMGSGQTIKEDFVTLKDDTVNLANNIKDNGVAAARDGIDRAYTAGQDGVQKVEEYVKEKPAQSVLIAFAVGLLASHVFSARR